jgi:arylsulfatase A
MSTRFHSILLALSLGAISHSQSILAADATPARRPNVVLIMADDLGYECIGANGSTSYATPHLDKLAAGGVRFAHCYAQPLCTPTRVQLMTGQYNIRNYVRFGLLEPSQQTFAHALKQAGYATGIVGKWQLAGGFEGPKHFGFDEYCLWQLTRRPPRYANPGLEIDGQQKDFSAGEYGPELVNRYALEFITRHKAQPFLLYYPMMLTHSPFQPTPDSQDWDPRASGEKVNQEKRHFGEMVAYMDKMIGRLVARLEDLGLREQTLILFTGDNGTGRGISSRMGEVTVDGGKGTLTDAGTRVPLIANWPGTIPGGRVSQDLIDTTDFLPTLCEAAGAKPPAGLLDGRSFLPQLRGETGQPREWVYCWYAPNQGKIDPPRQFARDQRYKLFAGGEFYQVDSRRYEETELNGTLSVEAAAAKKKLQVALDQFRDARPKELAAQRNDSKRLRRTTSARSTAPPGTAGGQ